MQYFRYKFKKHIAVDGKENYFWCYLKKQGYNYNSKNNTILYKNNYGISHRKYELERL